MRVLRTPGFRPLLAGQAVNSVGNWISIITIWGFAAFEFDAGAGDLALLFVVLSLPGALLGPLLGVWIDRLGPRQTLLIANFGGFVNALALTQADSYLSVIVLALPLGLVEALAIASLDALPPRMVDDADLVAANAYLTGAQDQAIIFGPMLAAVVNARWGLSGAFAADALTFLVGFAVAWRLKIDPLPSDSDVAPPDAQETHAILVAWQELRAGASLARHDPGIRWTLLVSFSVFSTWALFGVLEPLYVRDVLGRVDGEADTLFAAFQTVFGVGIVIASVMVARLGDRVASPRYVALAVGMSGVAAALYLGTKSVIAACVAVFVWGLDVAFFTVPVKTLLQRYTPVASHGRVMSLYQSLEPAAAVVVAPIAWILVSRFGVQAIGVAGGAAIFGIAVLALRTTPDLPLGFNGDASLGDATLGVVTARRERPRTPAPGPD